MSKLEELIQELCPDGAAYKPLEKCCIILDNKRKPVTKAVRKAGEYPYYGANGIQDYVSDYVFDGTFVLVGEDGSVVTDKGTPIVTWAVGKIWVNKQGMRKQTRGARKRGFCECGSQIGCSLERPPAQVEKFSLYGKAGNCNSFRPCPPGSSSRHGCIFHMPLHNCRKKGIIKPDQTTGGFLWKRKTITKMKK